MKKVHFALKRKRRAYIIEDPCIDDLVEFEYLIVE